MNGVVHEPRGAAAGLEATAERARVRVLTVRRRVIGAMARAAAEAQPACSASAAAGPRSGRGSPGQP